ncbi:MAG: phosphatidate cytidylyltransferase [Oscillospiraceae bacterium]|nr:phosphatidate cytidylyltransferase [Oscillospiraceae bacterium]
MLIRTLTGLALVPLLFLLLWAPPWAVVSGLGLMSAIAVYELLRRWPHPVKMRVMIMACGFVAVFYALIYIRAGLYTVTAALFLFLLILFAEVLIDSRGFTFFGLAGVFFAVSAIPAMYSSVARLVFRPDRLYVALLPFLITIISDLFALFTGKLLGRHKLAPLISPHKTWEGALGGYLFCVAAAVGYGAVISLFGASVDYARLALYGAAGGIVSQFGDLAMSAAKRSLDIKDFGRIFPGHGGILDRFDSLLFVAPVVEILVTLMPAIQIG